MGPSSGASLYYDLSQTMVVRGGLGVRVGGSLGAVCLANGIFCAVWFGLVDACSLIFFCLCVMMPKSLVCAKERSLLRRVVAILLSWRRVVELVSGVLWPFRLRSEAMEGGCEVVRGVGEGGAGVADGDAYELDSSPISSKVGV